MKKVIRYVWIFIVLLHKTEAWFEQCDYIIRLSAQNTQMYVNSPNYPQRYPSGSSCRYQVTAPPNYEINLQCDIKIDQFGPQCDSEFLYLSLEGDRNLKGSETFCGTGSFQRQSGENQLTLAYTSSSSVGGGSFSCLATITPCECGWSFSRKIVGGVEAKINEYPFMVGIMFDRNIFCGGTIISLRFVLTAAHCIKAKGTRNLQVLVGEHDIKTSAESVYTAIYDIDYVKIHEKYYENPDGDYNDIALLRTSKAIQFSIAVGPICLPLLYQYNLFLGDPVDIMGWGTTSFSGRISTVLLKTTVNVLNNDNCKAIYPNLQDTQICTYGNKKDACQFDSGGPVVYRNSRLFLVGLISYGKVCGSTSPTMSTRITSYLNWIQSNTGLNFCRKPFQSNTLV